MNEILSEWLSTERRYPKLSNTSNLHLQDLAKHITAGIKKQVFTQGEIYGSLQGNGPKLERDVVCHVAPDHNQLFCVTLSF